MYEEYKKETTLKIDWKRKLTSRKLWVSVFSFVTLIMIVLGSEEETAVQVSAIIMAGATVLGYVLGEGLADAGNGNKLNKEDKYVMSNELLVVVLGGGFTAAIVSGIIQIVMWKLNRKAELEDKSKNKDEYIKTALKILMQDRIKYLGKRYISDGSIDAEDLRDLMEMHKCYHDDLHGNGFLDEVMSQVKQLPITK